MNIMLLVLKGGNENGEFDKTIFETNLSRQNLFLYSDLAD